MMEPRQIPTFEANVARDLGGSGGTSMRLAAAYFGEPLPWQPHVLEAMLARDPETDKYASSVLGLSISRQNGKSWVTRARCFLGALCGERILYTCHHGDTSDEMFQELKSVFEDEANEELIAELKAVRKTNGKQAIEMKNGGCIRFTTRTDAGGRGKSFDVLIIDEAQELTKSQQSALLPTISAGKKKNPQTIYLGTPPDPKSLGTVFRELRDDVRSGNSRTAWIEWGVEEIGDKRERSRWFEANPSLGTLLSLTAVEAECEQMQPDAFARERLGWWTPQEAGGELALDPMKWDEAATDEPMETGKLAFGVKFSSDGRYVAVSWALAERDGPSYVELNDLADAREGTSAIAEMLLRNRDDVAAVCIDGKSGSAALSRLLVDRKFPRKGIIEGTTSDVQSAATMLRDELNSGILSHPISPALDASARGSLKRSIGRAGGWGFGNGAGCISAPIESASLALYAARTTRRDPSRRQEAVF